MTTNVASVTANRNRPASTRSLLVTLLLLLAPAASVHAEPLFSAPFTAFDAGPYPVSVAIVDLNADGRLDIVTGNNGIGAAHNTVSVLLGSGDGTFGLKTNIDTGRGMGDCDQYGCHLVPLPLAIADLNGDGRPDLAVTNHPSDRVSVLLGNGDGTFGPKTDFVTGSLPASVAIADLNADGLPDVVVTNTGSSTVSVLLGNGNGTFGAKTDFVVGCCIGDYPYSVAIADLNADGRLDLAVANANSHTVSVLLGNGDGTFGAKTDFVSPTGALSVAIADLNADGRLDLAVATGSGVSVVVGNGDGTFGPKTDFGNGTAAISVVIADLNADGRPDLVVGGVGGVSMMLGNGNGTFGPGTPLVSAGGGWVAIGDLNADGRPDVAAAEGRPGVLAGAQVSVLLGNGDGTFGPNPASATNGSPRSVAIADLNADGRLDLATASGNGVSVLLGNGDGTFGPMSYFATGDAAWSVAIADLNLDGRRDLVAANANSNTVSVLLGNGDGAFGPKTDYGTGINPASVAIADLNADGRPDLAVANGGYSTVSVLLGNGDGTFGPKADFNAGGNPKSVAIADLNSDGRPDLVVANFYDGTGNTVSVLLGNGNGTFRPMTNFVTGTGPDAVAIGDLNGDGRPDLAVANYSSSTVSVLPGNGFGTFGNKTDFATRAQPKSVVIRDLNADGRPDLTVANFDGYWVSYWVSVLLGNGDGTFEPRIDFGTGKNPASVAIGDLNSDGRPDLAVANYSSSTVTVLPHTGPTACPPMSFSLVSSPTFDLRSPELRVRVTLEPQPPALPEDIDIASIRLNGSVAVDASAPASIGDVDQDGRSDLTVMFSRMAVEQTVPDGDPVPVTMSGSIGSGCFEETAWIPVIHVPVTAPSAGSAFQEGGVAEVRWQIPAVLHVPSVALLFSSDDGSTWSLLGHGLPNTGSCSWMVPSTATDQARIAVVLVESADPSGYNVTGALGMSPRFVITAPLAVVAPRVELALQGSVPNPSSTLSVSFSLPDSKPARLVVYDVSGRELNQREVGSLGAGRHTVTLGASGTVAPGVYLVHLIRGDRRLVARMAVVR